MRKVTVSIHFASRDELRALDEVAKQYGGVRVATEFRPCFKYLHHVEKPHSALYLFSSEELMQAFVREKGTP